MDERYCISVDVLMASSKFSVIGLAVTWAIVLTSIALFMKKKRRKESSDCEDPKDALEGPSSGITLWVNGERRIIVDTLAQPLPRTTLLEYLRETGLKGTKLACGSGNCGACTVILSRVEDGGPRHRTVNACLMPLLLVADAHVTTIEGVGDSSSPHLIQSRIAEFHGSQCGFCTPGCVLNYALAKLLAFIYLI